MKLSFAQLDQLWHRIVADRLHNQRTDTDAVSAYIVDTATALALAGWSLSDLLTEIDLQWEQLVTRKVAAQC